MGRSGFDGRTAGRVEGQFAGSDDGSEGRVEGQLLMEGRWMLGRVGRLKLGVAGRAGSVKFGRLMFGMFGRLILGRLMFGRGIAARPPPRLPRPRADSVSGRNDVKQIRKQQRIEAFMERRSGE